MDAEEAAFRKVYSLLKPGGTLAMMLIKTDYQTPNPALYDRIQAVYSRYYKPEQVYMPGRFRYEQAPAYGYVDFEKHTFPGRRQYTGAEYAALCATHADTSPSPPLPGTLLYRHPGGGRIFRGPHRAAGHLRPLPRPQAPVTPAAV